MQVRTKGVWLAIAAHLLAASVPSAMSLLIHGTDYAVAGCATYLVSLLLILLALSNEDQRKKFCSTYKTLRDLHGSDLALGICLYALSAAAFFWGLQTCLTQKESAVFGVTARAYRHIPRSLCGSLP